MILWLSLACSSHWFQDQLECHILCLVATCACVSEEVQVHHHFCTHQESHYWIATKLPYVCLNALLCLSMASDTAHDARRLPYLLLPMFQFGALFYVSPDDTSRNRNNHSCLAMRFSSKPCSTRIYGCINFTGNKLQPTCWIHDRYSMHRDNHRLLYGCFFNKVSLSSKVMYKRPGSRYIKHDGTFGSAIRLLRYDNNNKCFFFFNR
jgi:hypothetical protein